MCRHLPRSLEAPDLPQMFLKGRYLPCHVTQRKEPGYIKTFAKVTGRVGDLCNDPWKAPALPQLSSGEGVFLVRESGNLLVRVRYNHSI